MPVHVRQMRSTTTLSLGIAGSVSALLVLPFVLLEWMSTSGFSRGFPAALFASLWILGAAFIVILMPMQARADGRAGTPRIADALRVILLIVIAAVWITLVVDQMPCLLGVPNCD